MRRGGMAIAGIVARRSADPHHPGPLLPALHPPFRGEEGDRPRNVFVGAALCGRPAACREKDKGAHAGAPLQEAPLSPARVGGGPGERGWGVRVSGQLQTLQIRDMPLHDLPRATEIPREERDGEAVAGFEAASPLLVGETEEADGAGGLADLVGDVAGLLAEAVGGFAPLDQIVGIAVAEGGQDGFPLLQGAVFRCGPVHDESSYAAGLLRTMSPATSASRARTVSPISTTKEGWRWRRRSSEPGTRPKTARWLRRPGLSPARQSTSARSPAARVLTVSRPSSGSGGTVVPLRWSSRRSQEPFRGPSGNSYSQAGQRLRLHMAPSGQP